MNVRSSRILLPALLVGIAGFAGFVPLARAGGWGILTLDDLPDHFVAGEPTELAFTARAHGVMPLSGLSVGSGATARSLPFQFSIVATDGKQGVARGSVTAEPGPGRYRAELTLPHAGDWKITVTDAVFGQGWRNVALPTTRAVEAGDGAAPAPAPLSPPERGLRLFVTKGCVGCHVHDATRAMGQTVPVGPVLTGRHFPEAYLASFLTDPASFRTGEPGLFAMPNLGLQPHEISALVAFLNAGS